MVFKKLPKKVVVHSRTHQVSYKKRVIKKDGNLTLAGKTNHAIKKIEVSLNQSDDQIESTLIHEILHAIAHEYEFQLSESMVLKLEQAIYETFSQNAWKIHVGRRKIKS